MKYDMDMVEVLALLRPANRDHMTLTDLSVGFKIVSEMIRVRTSRLPSASVSFLGARSNALVDSNGNEPSFETVLRIMHQSGYTGDIYPAPAMWAAAPTAVYARYPFPPSVESMRHGGPRSTTGLQACWRSPDFLTIQRARERCARQSVCNFCD